MARARSNRQGNLRERIAHLAARIMAEDGIDDFGYAKRKAARQAGAPDARAMPDNDEIEQALAAYRGLYQQNEHRMLLADLRRRALALMRALMRFNPHLVGSVLSGVAGKHSGIELHLFADSVKDFEIFLLNRGVRYKLSQANVFLSQVERQVPVYVFEHDGAQVRAMVLEARDQRHPMRLSQAGRVIERGSADLVEHLAARD